MVVHQGCRVYVNIHDAEYLRQRREWRRKLTEAHPDRGGTDALLTTTVKAYRTWEGKEQRWYERLNLAPPKYDTPEHTTRQPEVAYLLEMAAGRQTSLRLEVAKALAEEPKVTGESLATRLRIPVQRARVWLYRMRRRATRPTSAPVNLLRVLLDGQHHSKDDLSRVTGIRCEDIATIISRLRERGFRIETCLGRGRKPHTYRLVSFSLTPTEGTKS